MQFDDLNAEIREFCDRREWEQFHTPKDLAIGLSTESAELLEQFRFKDDQEQTALLEDPDSREAIEDELADVLFFLLRFADLYDVDLETALATKLDKNRSRYPEEEYTGTNNKHDE